MSSVVDIIDSGLCLRCGACVSLCPRGAAAAAWDAEEGWRVLVNRETCNECGNCVPVCPGGGIDFDHYARLFQLGGNRMELIGRYDELLSGWAADWTTRWLGSSGGVGTALVEAALEEGIADAALLTSCGGDRGLVLSATHVYAPAGVSEAAGSRYLMLPLAASLREVETSGLRYVVVGLPCHIQGVRLLQERSPVLRANIVGTVSLLCGMVQTPGAVVRALRRSGLTLGSGDSLLRMRGRGWPGTVQVKRADGSTANANYRGFYDARFQSEILRRCRWCPDATGMLADISLGDAWPARGAPASGLGESLIVVRGSRGGALLECARDRLVLTTRTAQEFRDSQAHLWRLKQRIVPALIAAARHAGARVPEYPGVEASVRTTDFLAAAVWEAKRRYRTSRHAGTSRGRYVCLRTDSSA